MVGGASRVPWVKVTTGPVGRDDAGGAGRCLFPFFRNSVRAIGTYWNHGIRISMCRMSKTKQDGNRMDMTELTRIGTRAFFMWEMQWQRRESRCFSCVGTMFGRWVNADILQAPLRIPLTPAVLSRSIAPKPLVARTGSWSLFDGSWINHLQHPSNVHCRVVVALEAANAFPGSSVGRGACGS